ncbi:c-type cytochrome [Tunturibacter empetritectus]|uniref:Mono/diheme cytochrome c family protein n=1 Tax=Tunturiibacter lichenicola TaxID=2051959 RepID=A0A7W8N412_9BACT|nr:cytochrome c [Edaphobacter lichenicola]MBB5342425.1 mono/diheme cytochrome c family protein [Edaphobacter lichenicola]
MNLLRSALFFVLATASCLPAFAESAKQRGAVLFIDNGCQHCHTIRNVGGEKGPDLSGVGRTLNKIQIRTQIVQGGHEMPSFADILKTAEVDDLVAYLHSCRDKRK